MKNCILQLLFFFVLSLSAYSQAAIRVYSTPDNFKNGIRLMVEKTKPGNYTCEVTFKQLVGYNCSEGAESFIATVSNFGTQQIALLTPIENASSVAINYSYAYLPGKSISKPDSLYPYLLPSHPGKSIQTSGVQYVGDFIGKTNNNFYSIGFKYQLGDTICAARGGIVYEIFDKAEIRKENEFFSTKTRNSINIEHNDGTLCQYNILSPIKMLVMPGDKVIPGQALAIFDKTDKDYTLLLSVQYLNIKYKMSTGSNYVVLRPRFLLSPNNINLANPFTNYSKVVHPSDIITKEMSSKEIKKLGLEP
jgi:hypothetical protein